MEKYKYLFKNVGLLTISQFATKLLSFFLVPLYTNILTTSEYGAYDIVMTTIAVLLPILTLNIQDSVLRFSLDKNENYDGIVSVGFKYFFWSNLIVLITLFINCLFSINGFIKEYSIYIYLIYFTQSFLGIVISFVRGIDKIRDLAISSIWASFFTLSCNILFLVVFKWALHGYFLANIIGPFLQSIYLFYKGKIYKYIKIRNYHKKDKEMVSYSRPLIANSIAWWVNNSLDRYAIVFFCGLAENGIYSVASKIPSILNIFQTIFNQAWTLSVVKDYDKDDRSGFFTNTYKLYNAMMVILCSGIIMFNQPMSSILYAKGFYEAWHYVPWLTMSIVFGALSGYIGGFFSAVKNSKIFAQSTIIGAIVNFLLNMLFVPLIGAFGAAFATTISYMLVWGIRYYHSKKYIKMQINIKKDLMGYLLLIIQSMYGYIFKGTFLYFIECITFLLICILLGSEMKMINAVFRKKVK